MAAPADRKYLSSHEWHQIQGDIVTIGITKFAIDELSDVTFVDISAEEGAIDKAETFGEVESVKATSEVYTGVAGQVIEVNQQVIDDPAILNQDAWDKGWLIKIKVENTNDFDQLLTAEQYNAENA